MQTLNNEKKFLEKKETSEYNDISKIKLKMEKMIKAFFKEEPSQFIYYLIDDEKNIEKIEQNAFEKNKIILEIKNWKKYYSKNSLIQLFLEVIKSNNIQSKNLNQILNELNYNNININNNNNNQIFFAESNSDIKMNSKSDLSENDEESVQFNSSFISLENILNINVNKGREEEKKSATGDKDEENESSCNAEYYESTHFLPLDECKDIEMQINSKDKENNNTNNIKDKNYRNYNKKKFENDKFFDDMDYLKKKTKNHISNY